jgi:hypothetical protein
MYTMSRVSLAGLRHGRNPIERAARRSEVVVLESAVREWFNGGFQHCFGSTQIRSLRVVVSFEDECMFIDCNEGRKWFVKWFKHRFADSSTNMTLLPDDDSDAGVIQLQRLSAPRQTDHQISKLESLIGVLGTWITRT